MTNLEAIKGAVGYPLADNSFILALTDRGLVSTDTYSASSRAFDLAKADCLVMVLNSPNVSEGGYSISMSDKNQLMKVINGIYKRYNVASPLTPTMTFKSPW